MTSPTASSSHASSTGSAGGGSAGAGSASTARTGRGGLFGAAGSRRPGDLAVTVALGLAIVSAVSALFFTKIPVDDRGEPLPRTFQAVAVSAREAITGQELPDTKESLLEASGPSVLLYLALPVAVAAFAFWANRRPDRSRLMTFALVAMAGIVLFLGGYFFFPSLIALAVASFQIRKADLPARVAEKAAPVRGRGDVIDADAEELEDRPAGLDGNGAGDEVEADEAMDDDRDPLAELEAEMEAEERARRGRGGASGASGASTPEE